MSSKTPFHKDQSDAYIAAEKWLDLSKYKTDSLDNFGWFAQISKRSHLLYIDESSRKEQIQALKDDPMRVEMVAADTMAEIFRRNAYECPVRPVRFSDFDHIKHLHETFSSMKDYAETPEEAALGLRGGMQMHLHNRSYLVVELGAPDQELRDSFNEWLRARRKEAVTPSFKLLDEINRQNNKILEESKAEIESFAAKAKRIQEMEGIDISYLQEGLEACHNELKSTLENRRGIFERARQDNEVTLSGMKLQDQFKDWTARKVLEYFDLTTWLESQNGLVLGDLEKAELLFVSDNPDVDDSTLRRNLKSTHELYEWLFHSNAVFDLLGSSMPKASAKPAE